MVASRVALGVMRMDVLEADRAAEVVEFAVGRGVTFFDTADIYGFGAKRAHASSEVFGRALRDAGVDRSSIQIQTKFGIVIDYSDGHSVRYDFSGRHLRESLDAELTALGVDYVDSVLLHRPDPLIDLDDVGETLDGLVASGKVRHIGVSNMNPWQIEYLQSGLGQRLQVNQLQFGLLHTPLLDAGIHVNMGDDDAIDREGGTLPYCRLKRLTVQAWSPFQSGTPAGPFVGNPRFPEVNAALESVARAHDTTPNAIATAWILFHPAQVQVVLGSMNPERLGQMIDGDDVRLERQEWWDLYASAGHRAP